MTHINPEMHRAIGSVIDWRVSYPIGDSDIRRWSVAVCYPEDAEMALVSSDGVHIAPEEFNPFAWGVKARRSSPVEIDPRDTDRPEKMIGVRGPGLKYQVAGGLDVEYGSPMQVGDVIRSDVRLVGYTERVGKNGPMLFTVTEDIWVDQDARWIKTILETSIRYGR